MADPLKTGVGPRPYWVLGNLADFVRKGAHKVFAEWNAKHGSIYVVSFKLLKTSCEVVCPLGTPYHPLHEGPQQESCITGCATEISVSA